MRHKTTAFLFLCATFICLALYSMQKDPHSFPDCLACHFQDPSGKILEHSLTERISMICERCHENIFTEGYLHPVDMRPREVLIPPDMPLSQNGEMTCATCHNIHDSYFTAFGTPSRYLRRHDRGREFCNICHMNSLAGGSRENRGHATTLIEPHFKAKYFMTSSSIEIDPISKNCVSCHDGSFSTSISIRAGRWSHGKEFLRHDTGSHPIGVLYEAARAERGRKTDLKPIQFVDRRIRFFDGKVGCGSCHDPYSTTERRLVMSDRNSRLCLACHTI